MVLCVYTHCHFATVMPRTFEWLFSSTFAFAPLGREVLAIDAYRKQPIPANRFAQAKWS